MVNTVKKISLILFFSVILGIFAVTPAQADFPASTGYDPQEITIDSSGNIYTANYRSFTVTKITLDISDELHYDFTCCLSSAEITFEMIGKASRQEVLNSI